MKMAVDGVLGDCGGKRDGTVEKKIHLSVAPSAKAIVITLLSCDYVKHSLVATTCCRDSNTCRYVILCRFLCENKMPVAVLKSFSCSLCGPSLSACRFSFQRDSEVKTLTCLTPQPDCHSRDWLAEVAVGSDRKLLVRFLQTVARSSPPYRWIFLSLATLGSARTALSV